MCLTSVHRPWSDAELPTPKPDEGERHHWLRRHLPAYSNFQPSGAADVHRALHEAKDGRMQRREARREVHVAAIHGQRVLHEIVRSDAEERDFLRQHVGAHRRGGRLHHDAERQIAPERDAARLELGRRFVEQLVRLPDLVDR